ncbi:DMT family transporter [Sulfitobacter albidus]|uniref:DMT family transporter n=1 Tax=Sulfitobacter albidus TaxID=2829501 RepID=A0A975PMX0_9RHOB|nr:DMT family transporter [Sulfitobacter albidus]
MAKVLGDTVSLGQLVLIRFVVQAGILLPIVWITGKRLWLSGRVLRLAWRRTVLHILGIGGMFTSLQFLPLADAIAIAFVMPFIMLLLGHLVLGEEVGARRMIACAVGFGGTLLVVQPNFVDVGAIALLPMGVAVVFALFMLTTRQIAKDVDPIALQALSGVMATGILLPLIVIGSSAGFTPLTLSMPSDTQTWMLFAALGALGTLAHLMMTWSLRFAPSATLAPMQYLEIPFATVIGYFMFTEFPNALAALGIAITMGAGVYVILREQATARRLAKTVPPTA